LAGLILLRPVFGDQRAIPGILNQQQFNEVVGEPIDFVQDNESTSSRMYCGSTSNGSPCAGKLVVVKGAVLDVCLDSPNSVTFGQHFKVELNGTTKEMLWIPPGFAHGFVALEDHTLFAYKCTAYYNPTAERTVRWNDPELAIEWGVLEPLISAKDQEGMMFSTIKDQLSV
jgi:dTDP-4-dehydrorhamnose 3,5-epimerase